MGMDAFTIAIEKLVYGGDGIGRRDGKAVFVPHSVPGDELLVRTVAEKKSYARAEIVRVVRPGEGRVPPTCPHFARCGGCDWQQLEYPRQVEAKRRILEELFHHRLPGTRDLEVAMIPCPQPFGYRSRARMQVHLGREKTSVGFFRAGSHAVQDVESCPLFQPALNEALRELRRAASGKGGVTRDDFREIDLACSGDAWVVGWPGDGTTLRKQVGDFHYEAAPGAFFQANDLLVEELAAQVSRCAGGGGAALDLYSGVGLFSLPLSRSFGAVTAVERSLAASRRCATCAAEAGRVNVMAVCADVAAWLRAQQGRGFDCVVLDPPRSGVAPGVMGEVARLAPETVVYASCDPQTLVRDLGALDANAYRVESVTGLDMFPQAYHFETVVKLTKTAP